MKKLLRKIKRILDSKFGTRVDENYWKIRYFFNKKNDFGMSLNHPHRKLIIDSISNNQPFEKVLELGCGFGPNLFLLSKKFPETHFYGIDISNRAINAAKKEFRKNKINNVDFICTGIDNLKEFEDKSVDISFSDAAMMYLGPDKITEAVKEIVRVTKKNIILCEQHIEGEGFYDDKWVHNYKKIFEDFVSLENIKIIKIPAELWDGDWSKYGYLIEINL